MTENIPQQVPEASVAMSPIEPPTSPSGSRSIINRLGHSKRALAAGVTTIAIVVVAVVAAALAGGPTTSTTTGQNSPVALATSLGTPDLNDLFADVSSCADTLDRLNAAVPSGPETVFTDGQGSPVTGASYAGQDGYMHITKNDSLE